jgi:hypothetical protein
MYGTFFKQCSTALTAGLVIRHLDREYCFKNISTKQRNKCALLRTTPLSWTDFVQTLQGIFIMVKKEFKFCFIYKINKKTLSL